MRTPPTQHPMAERLLISTTWVAHAGVRVMAALVCVDGVTAILDDQCAMAMVVTAILDDKCATTMVVTMGMGLESRWHGPARWPRRFASNQTSSFKQFRRGTDGEKADSNVR